MTKTTLTKTVIDTFPHPDKGQKFYWDDKQTGFGVRVTAGSKTYICQSRVKGKARRVSIASVGTLSVQEARKEAAKQLGQMATDIDPNAAKAQAKAKGLTFGDAATTYVKNRQTGTKPIKASTAKHIENCVDWYLEDWKSRPIKDVTPTLVVSRFNKITKENGKAVANVVFRYVRAIYNYARVVTKTDDNVATLPDNPVVRLREEQLWHDDKARELFIEDFPKFFDAIGIAAVTNSNRYPNAGADFADFVELLLRTGLRKAEASNLTWSDVDMTANTLTISAERAKNGKALTLPMATQTVAVMERLRERHSDGTYIWGATPLGDPRKTLEKARTAYGEAFSFHDLRRTFSDLVEDVAPTSIWKRLLNHAVPKSDVTQKNYSKKQKNPDKLRPYVQQVSDQIDKLASGEEE